MVFIIAHLVMQIWLSLLVTVIIFATGFKSATKVNSSLFSILFFMYRSLVSQTYITQYTLHFKSNYGKVIIFINIIIWILSSFILTACFTSILLGIYSSQKSYPLFNT